MPSSGQSLPLLVCGVFMGRHIDRFEIVRKIATGGMADVFLALQWGDGGFVREVVIKCLHGHLESRTALLEDFRNEAELLARLRLPGVPQVFDFRCSEEGTWYMAMEYVVGPTLKEIASSSPAERVDMSIALSAIIQLCRLLDEVHDYADPVSGAEVGLLHGDLTPSNVIVRPGGRPSLLDFGIAGDGRHRQARQGADHGIRGTVGYFAPEAASAQQLPDRRADVFSTGVLLYEMLAGMRPFPKESLAYVNAIRSGESIPLRDVCTEIPPSVAAVVMACLSPDPTDRPGRCGEVASLLEHAVRESGEALRLGPEVLADYVRDRMPARRGSDFPSLVESRDFVIPLPVAAEPESGEEDLSADERDELLADLALFAPDAGGFFESTPPAVPSAPPKATTPPSGRPISIPASELATAPPPEHFDDAEVLELDEWMASAPPPPPPTRPPRADKRTPIAFPSPRDLASIRPPQESEERPSQMPVPSKTRIALKRPRTSDLQLKNLPHPDQGTPLEEKLEHTDSDGFYIYVSDED